MSLSDKINTDLKNAMKNRDSFRLSTLRMVSSAISYAVIDKKTDLTDKEVEILLRKELKKRHDSYDAYTSAGRNELAEREAQEIEIIEEYLPKLMNEDEIREKITEIVKRGKFDNFGKAMGVVMSELNGKADGGEVSRILKELMK